MTAKHDDCQDHKQECGDKYNVVGKFRGFIERNNNIPVPSNSDRCIPPGSDNYYGRSSTWSSSNYHDILAILRNRWRAVLVSCGRILRRAEIQGECAERMRISVESCTDGDGNARFKV